MTTNVGQDFLTLLENDALITFAPSLVTFLNGVQAANGDPIKLALGWNALLANLAASAPTALGGLEGQLATVVSTKLGSLLSAASASAAGAISNLEGSTGATGATGG
jgi:hypothetical protein